MPNESVAATMLLGLVLSLFQALVLVMLNRLWKSVDDNTKAVGQLQVELPTLYASKEEVQRHHEEDRQQFKSIRDNIHEVRNKANDALTAVAILKAKP